MGARLFSCFQASSSDGGAKTKGHPKANTASPISADSAILLPCHVGTVPLFFSIVLVGTSVRRLARHGRALL